MSRSNYDKFPKISVPNSGGKCVAGWQNCAERLSAAIAKRNARRTVLIVECYPGVSETEIIGELKARLKPSLVVRSEEAMLESATIEALVTPFLGGNDPVFGFLSGLTLPKFFDEKKVEFFQSQFASIKTGLILAVGCGARHLAEGDILVYADLPRWEAQNRFRRNETNNLGADNRLSPASLQYKRAFFVDWRAADRWKRTLMHVWDFVLDTTKANEPKLADGEAVREAMRHAVTRPFRVVPFFDPAPWGGQWMRKAYDLDGAARNYGWGFDCVPEENSLLLEFGNVTMEIPSINVVFFQPRELLGESVHARFGDEFPIRFDFLDTMGGGNLSFQVHPLTEYIQHHFGMHYTQDESYYMLETGPSAHVYLGTREKVEREAMIHDLRKAQAGGFEFPADKYVNRFPARKHDHFLIPAGTVHCSGADSMVLEISATPYIFTFKMWDWGRFGLDGKPRPIHLDHGIANIQWERDTDWVKKNLVNRFSPLGSGNGWREEFTGLHEREFIETRRHWFTKSVPHHTHGGVNVLNLVEGTEAVVESVEGRFEPFVIHYAETFIVPAAVGPYTVRPLNAATNPSATMKAYVRESAIIAPLKTATGNNAASAPVKTSLQPVN
jgi:mannose-6-phosphate isomerase class I